jgi:hypothetical protein
MLDIKMVEDLGVRLAAPAEWRGGFGTCVQGGSPQTQIPEEPPTKDTVTTTCSWAEHSSRARPTGDPSSTTRMMQDSGSGRQLAQVQTWDSLGKSNHSTKDIVSLPTRKDAGPYWARTRD